MVDQPAAGELRPPGRLKPRLMKKPKLRAAQAITATAYRGFRPVVNTDRRRVPIAAAHR
jgi:hypothetical protein